MARYSNIRQPSPNGLP